MMKRPIKHGWPLLAALVLLLAACGQKAAVEDAPEAKVEGDRVIYADNNPVIKAYVTAAPQSGASSSLQLGGRITWD